VVRAISVISAAVLPLLALAPCAGCASPPSASPPARTSTAAGPVDLGAVTRARDAVPAGFEFGGLSTRVAPVESWGLSTPWSADPPQCAALSAPPLDGATVRGWSASGPGTIVYVVAAAGATLPDAAAVAACARFVVTANHTSGTVTQVPAPAVRAADTLGLRAEISTAVESGSETRSNAETFMAFLESTVVYATVISDPGAVDVAPDPGLAGALLTRAVSAVRGEQAPGG
jgi:hypothetical protein